MEHNHGLKQRMALAHWSDGELCIAWIDVANAFGRVQLGLLLDALRESGARDEIYAVVKDLYDGITTRFKGVDELSQPVKIEKGCLISGTLINLALDPCLGGGSYIKGTYYLS